MSEVPTEWAFLDEHFAALDRACTLSCATIMRATRSRGDARRGFERAKIFFVQSARGVARNGGIARRTRESVRSDSRPRSLTRSFAAPDSRLRASLKRVGRDMFGTMHRDGDDAAYGRVCRGVSSRPRRAFPPTTGDRRARIGRGSAASGILFSIRSSGV
jgi:hypothetical protein